MKMRRLIDYFSLLLILIIFQSLPAFLSIEGTYITLITLEETLESIHLIVLRLVKWWSWRD
jgi:hypothetical protein